MSEAVKGTLILALGNPLCGDDGVGTAVLQALALEESLPLGVILSFRGVNGLLGALMGQRWRRVILVDAAYMNKEPGEWRRLTLDTARLVGNQPESGGFWHRASVAEVLALVQPLVRPLPEIVIYGVQPLTVEPGSTMSAPVQHAVRMVCAAILAEIDCVGPMEWATVSGQPIYGQRMEMPCPRF